MDLNMSFDANKEKNNIINQQNDIIDQVDNSFEFKWGIDARKMNAGNMQSIQGEKKWVKDKLDKFSDEKDKKHNIIRNKIIKKHSSQFAAIVDEERRKVGSSREMYTLVKMPDAVTLGKEYGSSFKDQVTEEKRTKLLLDEESELYKKNKNSEKLEESIREFKTNTFDAVNRAMTRHAFRCSKEDYHDLAMFMKDDDKKNIALVNLYLGKKVKEVGGVPEGQNIMLALDNMAAQLFSIDIRTLKLNNDKDMIENAPTLEKISGQIAAFERMAKKHDYLSSLDKNESAKLNDRLESLRSIAAYYNVRKEIISDKYFKNHFNTELSMDIEGAGSQEKHDLAEKLVKSLVLGRDMMRKNKVDMKTQKYRGNNIQNLNEASRMRITEIVKSYDKSTTQKEIVDQAYKLKDAFAEKELSRLKNILSERNKINPIEELNAIQNEMKAVEGRAFLPVERPKDRISGWGWLKNRLMLGARWLFGATVGLVISTILTSVTAPVTLAVEKSRIKKSQDKRRHDIVPGREGEFFRDEIIRKDENGDDLEVYSDVRRGPLVWEKISAGDPDEPPEVCIMVEQSKRGSSAALETSDLGHAMIGLSYSRYNKRTKKKERYTLKMGYYPGRGIGPETQIALTGGAVVGGSLDDDVSHSYDISRRYKVTPKDINKILREAEKYSDKGYGYFNRNCSTFVVDMVKSIGLPVAEEFKEEEMEFKGAHDLKVEFGESIHKGGYFMGRNAISSHMLKNDMSYQNFGQKMYTKEDLERFKNTAGQADSIKKGYSPGALGEALRYSDKGEIGAYYKEASAVSFENVWELVADSGSNCWSEIIKYHPDINEDDEEIKKVMNAFMSVGDGGLYHLAYEEEADITPEDVRAIHKKIRDAMKIVGMFFETTLKRDKRLSTPVMKLLSAYESVLYYADQVYKNVVGDDYKGDIGILIHDYSVKEYEIMYIGENDINISAKMTRGIYEGYLMAGLSPREAIESYNRYCEINNINEKVRTSEEKAEFNKLDKRLTLAKNFCKANQYYFYKDEYDEKDIDYAFNKLPKMEKAASDGGKVSGQLTGIFKPSYAYQAVILEELLDGVKEIHLEQYEEVEQQAQELERHMLMGFKKNPDLIKKIFKAYSKGKTEGANDLVATFLNDIMDSYIRYAAVTDGLDETCLTGIFMTAVLRHSLDDYLVPIMNEVINNGEEKL